MKRVLPVLLGSMLGVFPLAWAATGGPDSFGVEFIDSNESDGPPHVALDILDEGTDLGLGDEDTAVLELPFDVYWYGGKESTAYVGDNGTLFWSGSQAASSAACSPCSTTCPLRNTTMWSALGHSAASRCTVGLGGRCSDQLSSRAVPPSCLPS